MHVPFHPLVWLQGTRIPFATASVTAALVGVGAAMYGAVEEGISTATMHAVTAVLGVLFLHLSANTFNDWVDWNATDRVNLHAGPFNGGSRVRLEGRISREAFLIMGIAFLVMALACGVYLLWMGRTWILLLGAAGAFLGAAYSLPPFSLQARGFGELTICLAFGPLLTLGTGYAVTSNLDPRFFLVGIPAGFLTSAILFINQFPDRAADEAVGKRHWVVRLGTARARWMYLVMVLAAVLSLPLVILFARLPGFSVIALSGFLPLAMAVPILWRHHGDPPALMTAQQMTIVAQALSQGIFALTLFVA